MLQHRTLTALALTVCAGCATAQWNPAAGDWGKSDPDHLRVMTWNVRDNIRANEFRQNTSNSWNAIVRVLADLRPDVLILQETGDNGTPNGVDSVPDLGTVCRLLFEGGPDPFLGGSVGAFVQQHAPGYDLPHVFVSSVTDGFNRNIILSRYPFADLNGAGGATSTNTVVLPADAYSPAGNAGIRGWMFAEIDLPDAIYAGDAVVGNSHMKSGGSSSDAEQRLRASQVIAYTIDYLFNGAGTGIPDPNNSILVDAATVLDPDTPVIWGGDLNEDENTNGRRGPAAWLAQAEFAGGTDGTDRDGGDSRFDNATDVFTGSRTTIGSRKVDYLLWQDSIATRVRSFVFNSGTIPAASRPAAVASFPGNPASISGLASDHRPVIVDLELPEAPACQADWDNSGAVDVFDILAYLDSWNTMSPDADLTDEGTIDIFDVLAYLALFDAGC